MKKIIWGILCVAAPVSWACNPSFPETFFDRDPLYSGMRHRQDSLEPTINRDVYHAAVLLRELAVVRFPEQADRRGRMKFIFSRSDAGRVLAEEFAAAAKAANIDDKQAAADFTAFSQWRDALAESSGTATDLPSDYRGEFYLYELGKRQLAIEADAEPEAWNRLMALAPEQRRYRTCPVLYLRGNRLVKTNPDAAFAVYERLRQAASDGFFDARHLAESSYWTNTRTDDGEAQLRYLLLGHLVSESASGDSRFINELELRQRSVQAPKNALTREILFCFDPMSPRLPPDATFLGADVQSYFALGRGDLETARRLLKKCEKESLLSLYVGAKLARSDGDYGRAAYLLRNWLARYQKLKQPRELERFRREVSGTLGMVLVNQSDFSEALYVFLKAGELDDACTVAEQCLPLDVLADFLRVHRENNRLNDLLCRRALREGRGALAVEFAAPEKKALVELYCRRVARGNRATESAESRAMAFFDLGRMQSQYGMQLLGYELGPDEFRWNGLYGGDAPRRPVLDEGKLRAWEWTHGVRRFHYRDRAIESFTRAAQLTSNPDVKLAALILAYRLTQRPKDGRRYDGTLFNRLICDMRPAPLAEVVFSRRAEPLDCALLQVVWPLEEDTEPERLNRLLQFDLHNRFPDVAAMKRAFAALKADMSIDEVEKTVGPGAYPLQSGAFPFRPYPMPDYLTTGHAILLQFDNGRLIGLVNRSGGSFPNPLAKPETEL